MRKLFREQQLSIVFNIAAPIIHHSFFPFILPISFQYISLKHHKKYFYKTLTYHFFYDIISIVLKTNVKIITMEKYPSGEGAPLLRE